TVFAHALLLADVVAYQDGRARTAPIPSSGYSVALFLRAETPGKFHKYNTVKVRKCKGRKKYDDDVLNWTGQGSFPGETQYVWNNREQLCSYVRR
ncbi:MAG: hypothetical protein J5974_11475, partial [Pyramidobacter sp.]|nr:hypothetical protein [Pyramidobacter sp.]